MKNKQDPVALDDSEYPAWLWTVLANKGDAAGSTGADAEGDLFCKFGEIREEQGGFSWFGF